MSGIIPTHELIAASEQPSAVSWSDEDACWIAQSTEHRYISAHGDTYEEALRELDVALNAVAAIHARMGQIHRIAILNRILHRYPRPHGADAAQRDER